MLSVSQFTKPVQIWIRQNLWTIQRPLHSRFKHQLQRRALKMTSYAYVCCSISYGTGADFAVLFVLCVYVCAFGGYVFASATLASVLEKNAASIVVISVVFASAISNLRFSPVPIVMDDRGTTPHR